MPVFKVGVDGAEEAPRSRPADDYRLIARIYENTVDGMLSDSRFAKRSAAYKAEQDTLDNAIKGTNGAASPP